MAAATEKPAKPARRRTTTTPRARRVKSPATPTHAEISERAYFISLRPDASDELGNWVRAEQELRTAA